MGTVNPTRGQLGGPRGDFETAEHNALSTVIAELNGNLDSGNVKDASIALGDLVAAVQQALIPAGTFITSGRSTAPAGYVLCDGSPVSRIDQAALFDAIGTAYGAGDGSTTFNLPDCRGRVLVGKGTHSSVDTLGDADALGLSSRAPVHQHNYSGTTTFENNVGLGSGTAGLTATGQPHKHDYSGTTTVSGPAFLTANVFIKT